MALVLSSCSHDDSQVNNGWVIYDLRPLEDGCIMYYGEDERISIFYNNRLIKFVGYQGEYNIGDSIKIVKYNIMRKVKGDAVMPPYTGFGYNPVKKFIN
jgi:hypothetical protein